MLCCALQEEEEVHDTTPEDVKNFCATQACADPSDVVKVRMLILSKTHQLAAL